jgi:Predicted amidophosphoribosyltransferases
LQKHINVSEIDMVIPVPLHRSKLRERGFNQAGVLAESLAVMIACDSSLDNLIRVRKTKSQFALAKEERLANVFGAFSCRNPAEFCGKTILLIDDIFTTGATTNECARILKQAGAARIIAFSLAR